MIGLPSPISDSVRDGSTLNELTTSSSWITMALIAARSDEISTLLGRYRRVQHLAEVYIYVLSPKPVLRHDAHVH